MNQSSVTQLSPGHLLIAVLVGLLAFGTGCERSPEDLEEWRDARDGMAQLATWAEDDGEPTDVRVRAIQILIEEGESDRVPRTLDAIEDEQMRQQLADEAMPTIQSMWDEQDFPELTEEMQQEGAEIPIEDFDAVQAIDAIYRLHPYLSEANQEQASDILREWISEDQELRTQLAETNLPLLVQYAGDDAAELVTNWLHETHDPRTTAGSLRRHTDDDADLAIDETVGDIAEEQHPELDDDIRHAVIEAESDGILDYLEMALDDDEVDNEFRQAALDTLATIGSDDAIDMLVGIIENRPAPFRWASANVLLDALGTSGLVDIASALPDDTDDYELPDNDSLQRYVSQLCVYADTNIERGEMEHDPDVLAELLDSDQWPAQLIGLRCAGQLGATSVRDEVQALSDTSTDIPAWGDSQTIGGFADQVDAMLAEDEDDDGDEDDSE